MLGQGLRRGRLSQVDFACELLLPPRSVLLVVALGFGAAGLAGVPGGLLGVLSRWSIDVALLPANGGDYFRSHRLQNPVDPNLNFREAVDLASALGVRLLVPTHTDLFGFNTENLAYLVDYARRSAPRLGLKLMYPGEVHCHVNW